MDITTTSEGFQLLPSMILIEPGDEKALSDAMIRLAGDEALRKDMGEAGRKLAAERYAFEHCLDLMEAVYTKAGAG